MLIRQIFLLLISYLIGSFPSAYVAGRISKNIDIRKFGSGNVGATNAFRVLGKFWGMLVLIVDFLKGFFCVGILPKIFNTSSNPNFLTILGIVTICGHAFTIFLKFKGGKGVATGLGVLLGLGTYVPQFYLVLLIVLGVWMITLYFSDIVSLSSILAAVSLPLASSYLCREYLVFSILVALLIIWRHRENIKRLLKKQEFTVRNK